MSISRETADQTRVEPIADASQPQPGSGAPLMYPSEVVEPTRSNTLPQQGNSQPQSGSAVHNDADKSGEMDREGANVSAGGQQVPFAERVIGVAKKTRGTLLHKPELKEHGEKILEGTATVHEPPSTS